MLLWLWQARCSWAACMLMILCLATCAPGAAADEWLQASTQHQQRRSPTDADAALRELSINYPRAQASAADSLRERQAYIDSHLLRGSSIQCTLERATGTQHIAHTDNIARRRQCRRKAAARNFHTVHDDDEDNNDSMGRDSCDNSPHLDLNTEDEVNFRRCRISNLCAQRDGSRDGGMFRFTFIHGPDTDAVNVPVDRYGPALASLTSALSHNVHFFNYDDRLVDDSLRAELAGMNITRIKKHAQLFSRFKPDNIMHIIHDDALPLYQTLQEAAFRGSGLGSWRDVLLVFADPFSTTLQQSSELMQHLSNHPLFFLSDHLPPGDEEGNIICFDSVDVGVSKRSVWYDYGFHAPQRPVKNSELSSHLLVSFAGFIRNRLGGAEAGDLRAMNAEITEDSPIVLLIRESNRLILNQAELAEALRHEFRAHVVTVSMSTHSFHEQVAVLSRSRGVVGVHGSLMVMSLFLPPNAFIVEIFPYAVPAHHYTPYRTMATLRGSQWAYRAWENPQEHMSVSHIHNPANLGGIVHLPTAMQTKILKSRAVPRHLCCDDPEWLFRIYQDTYVDVNDIVALVKEMSSNKKERLPVPLPSPTPLAYHLAPTKARNAACSWGSLVVGDEVVDEVLRIEWERGRNWDQLTLAHVEVWVENLMRVYKTQDSHIHISDKDVLGLATAPLIWVRAVARSQSEETAGPFAKAECS